MARPRSDTRERLVSTTAQLLRQNGFHGTGMSQIIQESQAPRGSVYFLFPGGKDELTAAAVAYSAAGLIERMRAAAAQSPDVETFAADLIAGFGAELHESGYTQGCPITTVTLDVAPGSAQITAACRDAYADWIAALSDILAGYGVSPASGLATICLSAMEGALVLCRAAGNTSALEEIRPQLVTLLRGSRLPRSRYISMPGRTPAVSTARDPDSAIGIACRGARHTTCRKPNLDSRHGGTLCSGNVPAIDCIIAGSIFEEHRCPHPMFPPCASSASRPFHCACHLAGYSAAATTG